MKTLITAVAHLGIRVFDLGRSRAFYEKLGFALIVGPVGPEPVAILRNPNGVEINLILNAKLATDANILQDVPDKHAGYTHVALGVTDMAETIAALGQLGIPIKDGPIHYPNGSQGLFIRDPDLNVIELYQPARRG